MNLQELEEWGVNRDFGAGALRLNVCEEVADRKKFFYSHLNYLKGVQNKPRRKTYLPYYNRLMTFIRLIELESV